MKNNFVKVIYFLGLFSCVGCSGVTESIIEDNGLNGTLLTAKNAVYYMEGCRVRASCGETRVNRRVDRILVCDALEASFTSLYENSYKIEYETTFEVVSVAKIGCFGLQCSFSYGDYYLVELKDSRGVRSTKNLSSINRGRKDVCGSFSAL